LLDAQRLYSEISASITTAVAARTVLNRQRHSIQDLYHEGLLDINEYQKLKGSVEYQMKKLLHHPPLITMPNKKDILSQIPWLECVSSDELSEISSFFEDFVFQRGDILVKQDEPSDSVHVLARGSVVVTYETESGKHIEIEELGIGSVFGEIAWALKGKRGASIIASSPGLLFTINSSSLRHIAGANEQLETKLWETCGRRLSENMLSMQYGKSRRQIREMTLEMHLHKVDPIKKKIWFLGDTWVIILRGVAIVKDDESNKSVVFEAPDILRSLQGDQVCYLVEFSTDARFMCQPSALQSDVGNRRTGRKLKAVEGLVQL
jgi:CRP-like cAMP-binding protein